MTTDETTTQTTASADSAQSRLTSEAVWKVLSKASFAVLGHCNASGEPRSSGVVYGTAEGRLYVAVAPDSLKARHCATCPEMSLTVPVRKGGLLTLLFPIPPATISFQAKATLHAPGSLDLKSISPKLARLLPPGNESSAAVIELEPVGSFLTFGIGVSLMDMRIPAKSRARVPVAVS